MIESGNALLLLKKWAEQSTSLLFQFSSTEIACAIDGTLAETSDSWQVRSRAGDAKLSFCLDGCKFEFADRRSLSKTDVPDDVAEKSHLLVFFPSRLAEEISTLTVSELLSSEMKEL